MPDPTKLAPAMRRLVPIDLVPIGETERLLKPVEAAELLKVSPKTLANRRCRGEPPSFVQLSRNMIRYRLSVIVDYIRQRERTSTTEAWARDRAHSVLSARTANQATMTPPDALEVASRGAQVVPNDLATWLPRLALRFGGSK